MKAKLYPHICSNCGCRFYSLKRMDARCQTCVEALNVKVERRDGVCIETRGRAVIGSFSAGFIHHI